MNIPFSKYEMERYLEDLGYTIKEDFIEDEIHWNGMQSEKRTFKVFNVYYLGTNLTDFGSDGRYGEARVEKVFRDELKKRLLKLR